MEITANMLKTKGVSLLGKLLSKYNEVIVSVRGKKKYVVLKIEDYEKLEELLLEKAVQDALNDYKNGKFTVETAEEHIKKLEY